MKLVYKGIGIAAIVFLISVIVVIAGILHGWMTLKPVKSDCIIILGCKVNGSIPSAFLAERIEEGFMLYKEGKASYVIASGGQGPTEDVSEAEAIRQYLVKMGMPQDKIILENQSTSTWANLENSFHIMKQKGFQSAIIVSNKFHLKRASMMTDKLGMNASFSGVYVSTHKADELGTFFREILATYKYYLVCLFE